MNLLNVEPIISQNSEISTYDITYFNNLDGLNSCYVAFDKITAYIRKDDGENKYLVFTSTDDTKEILKKYTEIMNKLKSRLN